MTGQDIKVIENKNQEENRKKRFPVPSKITEDTFEPRYFILQDKVQEDFTPAENAFDVSLVLAWIASQHGTVSNQLKWIDIPKLIHPLVAEHEQLRLHWGKRT